MVSKRKAPHVRWWKRADYVACAEIDQQSFQRPWNVEKLESVNRMANCFAKVAECQGRIVGFVIYESPKHVESIVRLAVAPDVRRTGIGSQLIAALVAYLTPRGRNRIEVVVPETNLIAQKFFASRQFLATEISRGHFRGGEDGYIFEYALVNMNRFTLPVDYSGVEGV